MIWAASHMALAVKCWSRSNFTLFIQIPCWASPWRGVSEVCCNQKNLLRNNHCRCFRLRLFRSIFWMMLPITKNTFGKQKSEDLAEQTNYIFQRWAGVTSWRRIPLNTMASSWIAITPSLWWKVFWTEISQLSQAQKKNRRFFLVNWCIYIR